MKKYGIGSIGGDHVEIREGSKGMYEACRGGLMKASIGWEVGRMFRWGEMEGA